MDGRRFDGLARLVAAAGGASPSRRGLVGSLLGLGVGLLGVGAVEAQTCPQDQLYRPRAGCVCRATGRPPGDGGCPCPGRTERCGGACVDPRTAYLADPANCGGCGIACGPNASCRAGACIDRQGTCAAGADSCEEGPPIRCKDDPLCQCYQTTSGAAFCGDVFDWDCRDCATNTQCEDEFGPGAACLVLHTECSGPLCAPGRACMAPCPTAP